MLPACRRSWPTWCILEGALYTCFHRSILAQLGSMIARILLVSSILVGLGIVIAVFREPLNVGWLYWTFAGGIAAALGGTFLQATRQPGRASILAYFALIFQLLCFIAVLAIRWVVLAIVAH
jgi:hypothetical protein